MKLAIGCDHGGFELKEEVLKFLNTIDNIAVSDFGPAGRESVDYPDFAIKVSEAVSNGTVDRGILICGTGIGMSIVANRFPKVRAALCHDHFTPQRTRPNNDPSVSRTRPATPLPMTRSPRTGTLACLWRRLICAVKWS